MSSVEKIRCLCRFKLNFQCNGPRATNCPTSTLTLFHLENGQYCNVTTYSFSLSEVLNTYSKVFQQRKLLS